jgi:hypothetical protein
MTVTGPGHSGSIPGSRRHGPTLDECAMASANAAPGRSRPASTPPAWIVGMRSNHGAEGGVAVVAVRAGRGKQWRRSCVGIDVTGHSGTGHDRDLVARLQRPMIPSQLHCEGPPPEEHWFRLLTYFCFGSRSSVVRSSGLILMGCTAAGSEFTRTVTSTSSKSSTASTAPMLNS